MISVRTLVLPAIAALLVACSPDADQSGSTAERIMEFGQPKIAANLQAARYVARGSAGAPLLKVGIEELEIVSVAVLGTKRAGVETWLTDNSLSFSLEDGFLRSTRGFGDDLMSTDVSQSKAAVLARRNATVERFMTFIGAEQQTVARSYVCDIEVRGARELTVNAKVVKTTLVAETCNSTNQTFENLYWLRNSSNKMVQSRQWASDLTGPLVMRDGPKL